MDQASYSNAVPCDVCSNFATAPEYFIVVGKMSHTELKLVEKRKVDRASASIVPLCGQVEYRYSQRSKSSSC